MALTGNENNINILIQSTFDNKGFQSAITNINQLKSQLSGISSSMGQFAGTVKEASKGLVSVSNSAKETATSTYSATSEAKRLSEAYRAQREEVNKLTQGSTYLGQSIRESATYTATNTSALVSMGTGAAYAVTGLNSLQGAAKNTSGVMGAVSGAVNGVKGYMGGLITQTISVGDIFGYYIGTMALNAVNDFVFGVSVMRDEMETTFEYMGMATDKVESFSKELTDFAIAMPTLSIAGVNAIARTLAMGGADMMEIAQYKQTWADMAEIGAALNGISAEAAAAKVGPAITDAMGGSYKRLLNIMNVTSSQFKDKAAQMGVDTEGSFSGVMQVLQAIMSDRGLAGIATKITSIGDAWNYTVELISAKGGELGDAILPLLKTIIPMFGNAIAMLPVPVFAVIAAFMTLMGALLVIMPLLGSFKNGFDILKLALQPMTSRLKEVSLATRGYGDQLKLTNNELRIMDQLSKSQLGDLGVKRTSQIVPGQGKQNVYYETVDEAPYRKRQQLWNLSKEAADRYQISTGKVISTEKIYGSVSKSTNTNLKGMTTGLNSASTGFKGMATSIGVASKAALTFMLTNPLGIILTLISAILLIVTYTDSWGRVTSLLNGIMKDIANVLNPLVNKVIELGEAGWNAIKKWEGWTSIANFIQVAYDNIKGFAEYVSTLNAKSEEAGGGVKGLGDSFNHAGQQANILTSNIVDGTGGVQSFGDVLTGLNFIMGMLLNPMTTFVWAIDLLNKLVGSSKQVISEWLGTLEGQTELDSWNSALKAFTDAWTELDTTINTLANELRPTLDELGNAWNGLMESVFGKQKKGEGGMDPTGGGDTQKKIGLVTVALEAFKTALWAATIVVRWLADGINALKPAFKAVATIITIVAGFFTILFRVIRDVYNGYKSLEKVSGPFVAAMMLMVGPLMIIIAWIKELWHWITGNSPGLIPAFTDLYLLIMNIWPLIQGIVTGAINSILGTISGFVSQTLSWFRGLPGQIGAALSSLRGFVVQEFWNAYYGAQNMIGQFFQLGKQIKDQVVAGIKSALEIGSPSKVTYGLGEYIAQGLIYGMTDWVKNNVSYFSKYMAKDIGGILTLLSNMFANFHYQFYYDSMYSVSTVLQTMTGNCWDAAQAFIALASQMGLTAQLYRTFVNGIPHMVVNLPQVGAWIDPSGILGRGIQGGSAPGSPAGVPINVYINDPVVKEEEDINGIAKKTGRKVLDAVRFGI